MKRWYKISMIFVLSAAIMLSVGCTSTEADMDCSIVPGNEFIIEQGNLNFNFERGQEMVFIPVTTDIPEEKWTIEAPSGGDSWCKISRSYDNEKGLQLLVEESNEAEIRSATMRVGGGGNLYTINVRQLGYGPAILVNDLSIGADGGEVELEITANIDYIIGMPKVDTSDGEEWLEPTGRPETRAFAQKGYQYYAQANMMPFTRKATIAITAVDPMYFDASTECSIVQATKTVFVDKLPTTQAKIVSGTANQMSKNEGSVEAMFDGDYSTFYHSPWESETPTTEFPVIFEFKLDGTTDVDYMMVMHRAAYNAGTGAITAGHGSGRIGKMNVYYKNDQNKEYLLLTDPICDLAQLGGYQRVDFPARIAKPTAFKLEILDGSGGNDNVAGFVAPAEIEFFADMSADYNNVILKVFTDLSCSELNGNVTRSDITALYAIAPYLAQYVAVPMMDGTYLSEFERQFRIAAYKPYSNIDINNRLLTKKYSRMDNPTGIEVKSGDKLIVCVDKIPAGQSVSLAVYGDNGDYANYGGMSGNNNSDTVNQEVQLQAGYNAIDITADGMCYVMNTANTLSAASQSVKVHIATACGTVQGYFDIERHSDADYMDMLSRTTYKYFVAKGKNMIFNFHTSKLKELAPSGISSGLSAWDDIQGWQKELMGLDKIDYFNNHIMAVSSSGDAYMDASNRRVNFGIDNALPKIISREALLELEDNTWGPAHELGHVNQGAINWKSTTESSNNLFSNYAIYKMGKYKSRGQTISYLAECFAKAQPWALMGSSTHQNEDTEVHMRMNWQLWNYFHRCGVKPDFFPTLFEMLRQDPLPSEFASYFGMAENPGASQLKYAEKVCEAAQLDLTEFFEVWGFYRTIDVNYEQYGSSRYNVTEDMIAQSKASIAEKGYAKAPAIQYIEDRQIENNVTYSNMGYYTTFQNKTAITKTPRYSVSGRTYTVSDCDQAVAVEVRRTVGSGLGELLYFSNLTTFELPSNVTGNVTLYAVQYDGERKAMSNN